MPQPMVYVASQGATCIKVICDDTDVFILLIHYYYINKLACTLLMEGTSSKRTIIDIGATSKKHATIVPQLLAAHSLTG
jgi:hypothetical protein